MRAALRIARIAARAAPAAPRAVVPCVLPSASALPSSSVLASSSVRGFSTTPATLKKATKKDAKKSGDNKKGGKKKAEAAEEEEGGMSESEIDAIIKKTNDKMTKSLDWAKGVLYEGVERGRGRVSPAILDTVKVAIPDQGSQPLKAVAGITVTKGGLLVEAYDSDTVKHVESALHKANLPGMSPQRDGDRIRLPVSRPDTNVRNEIVRSLGGTVEDAKNQMRQARSDGIKSLGGKNAEGADEIQSALESKSKEIDEALKTAKKELEKA